MVIKAKLELEKQLAKLEGRKLDDAKAMVERERAKEARQGAARGAAQGGEGGARSRQGGGEGGEAGGARRSSLAAARKKEDEILRKQREAKYPIDDEELAAEFAKESAEKGVDAATLGYNPSRRRRPWRTGRWSRTRQRSRIFSSSRRRSRRPRAWARGRGSSPSSSACGNDLANAYKAFMVPIFEIPATTPGIVPRSVRHRHQAQRGQVAGVMSDGRRGPRSRRASSRGRRREGPAPPRSPSGRGRSSPWASTSRPSFRPRRPRARRRKARAIISKRLDDAAALRTGRILEYNAEAARRPATEPDPREKRKAIRAAAAAKRKAEEKGGEAPGARAMAMAAGEEVEDDADDDDDEEEDADDDDNAENADAREDDDDDEGPQMDDDADAREEEKQPSPEKPQLVVKVKAAKKTRVRTPPAYPRREPTFELPKHLREYEGHRRP